MTTSDLDRLENWAKEHGIVFTKIHDSITFSYAAFDTVPAHVMSEFLTLLNDWIYKTNLQAISHSGLQTMSFSNPKPISKRGDEKVSPLLGLPRSRSSEPIIGWRTWRIGRGMKILDKRNGEKHLFMTKRERDSFFQNFKVGTIEVREQDLLYRLTDYPFMDIECRDYALFAAHVTDCVWNSAVMTTNESNGQLAPVAVNNKAKFRDERGDYGIYSYKTPHELYAHHGILEWGCLGEVENYGHVIEHEFGYRAQKSIIKSIYLLTWTGVFYAFPGVQWVKESLENRYQCPVEIIANPAEYNTFMSSQIKEK